MNKKSPYKSPIKAGKSPAKQNSVAKKLSPIRKQMKKSPTKQEKAQGRLRAQEWAKKELGRSSKQVDSPSVIVIDDDDNVEEEPKVCVASVKQTTSTTTNNVEKCEKPASAKETLHKSMLKLDIENQKMTKSDGACDKSTAEEEEVFYDALEFLPKQKNKDDDVTVEDVSDVEDDEIRDLRSVQRNRVPSRGWMEPLEVQLEPEGPLEPEGYSFSTFSLKLEP